MQVKSAQTGTRHRHLGKRKISKTSTQHPYKLDTQRDHSTTTPNSTTKENHLATKGAQQPKKIPQQPKELDNQRNHLIAKEKSLDNQKNSTLT